MGWKIFTAALVYGFYDVVTAGALAPILFFSCCGITYLAVKPKRLH
jgi:hypothetical protein